MALPCSQSSNTWTDFADELVDHNLPIRLLYINLQELNVFYARASDTQARSLVTEKRGEKGDVMALLKVSFSKRSHAA